MAAVTEGSIVVGVEESDPGREALRWAVQEGSWRSVPVTAVLAWSYLDQHGDVDGPQFRPDYTAEDAEAALRAIVEQTTPGADVAQVAICDLPARALLDASREAEMLVVGARGHGGLRGMVLGSVSQQCAHHTTVPLAIVRSPVAPVEEPGRIVVGVDGSENSLRSLRWAVDEARARQASLRVVHASHRRRSSGGADAGTSVIAGALAEADTSGLPSDVEPVEAGGAAAAALLDAAEGAALIVVGSRGRGGFSSLLLGSVSQHVVNHAACPVVIIPPADRAAG